MQRGRVEVLGHYKISGTRCISTISTHYDSIRTGIKNENKNAYIRIKLQVHSKELMYQGIQ